MRTNKLTNKQTPLKTAASLRYATPVGTIPTNQLTSCRYTTRVNDGNNATCRIM